ncbi:MAG: GNAT family N-acetyltransferase, partial [Chloroflexaceae bacterium]|nr:GNAT family N-acetyltransferase [Chloroflexaceae bacterium]
MTQTQRMDAAFMSILRDGREVMIRPLEEADRDALTAFGMGLPLDELLYIEDDFQAPELIARLVNAAKAENWRQLVAEVDDGSVAAYAAVRRLPGWMQHVADVQLIVAEPWRRSGLGTELADAIFAAARELEVAKVVVEMLEEQRAGRAIFERL